MTSLEAAYAGYGMDYKNTIGRTAGDEELLRQLLDMFLADQSYRLLTEALDAGDTAAAFSAAHSLKGSSGMLGMTRLQAVLSEMTELLRTGDIYAASELRGAAGLEYASAVKMISSL